MAVSVMTLVRMLARKIMSTTNTQKVPSRIASTTLSMAAWMKSAWRKTRRSTTTPGGASRWSSSSALSSFGVRSSVFAVGCFWMASMTLLPPTTVSPSRTRTLPSPRRTGPPNRTSATSLIRTARSPRQTTGVSSMSRRARVCPLMRMSDSFASRSITPPPASTFAFSAASLNCWRVTFWAASRAGEVSTWYCLRWPPITVTCDTPSTASSRFRTANSPNVRISMPTRISSSAVFGGSVGRSPTSITSPMMLEMGAMTGFASRGSRSRTSCNFSATTWRSW